MVPIRSFKPSKDRYKLLKQRITKRSTNTVSNPQRIATNSIPSHVLSVLLSVSNPQRIATNLIGIAIVVIVVICFKPSKDRYKLHFLAHSEEFLQTSFKPSKDRYKPTRLHTSKKDIQVSNPQRIATNVITKLAMMDVLDGFQTLKGSLQTTGRA